MDARWCHSLMMLYCFVGQPTLAFAALTLSSNRRSKASLVPRQPATTRSLQFRYSRFRSRDHFGGGVSTMLQILAILSAIFIIFARVERCGACSICICLRAALDKD